MEVNLPQLMQFLSVPPVYPLLRVTLLLVSTKILEQVRLFIASWLTQAPPLFDTPVSIANSRTFEQVRLFIASCKHNSFLLSVALLVYTPFNFSKGQGQNLWFPSPSFGEFMEIYSIILVTVSTPSWREGKRVRNYGVCMRIWCRIISVERLFWKKYLLNCKPKLYS